MDGDGVAETSAFWPKSPSQSPIACHVMSELVLVRRLTASLVLTLLCLLQPAVSTAATPRASADAERSGLFYGQGAVGLGELIWSPSEQGFVAFPAALRVGLAPLPGLAFGPGVSLFPGGDGEGSLTVMAVEGFATLYVDPRKGFHVDATGGYGSLRWDGYHSSGTKLWGFIAAIGVGYEFRAEEKLSMGPLLRVNYGRFTHPAQYGYAAIDGTFTAISALATFTYY